MCTVLVITNDHLTSKRITAILEGMELTAVLAATDFEVTRACVASRAGIVISDVEMPGGVGFESIATARRLVKDAYIIAVSRDNHEELWSKVALACGADEYVPGSLSPARLLHAIETCNGASKSISCLPSD